MLITQVDTKQPHFGTYELKQLKRIIFFNFLGRFIHPETAVAKIHTNLPIEK
jgi:hypothetical protein